MQCKTPSRHDDICLPHTSMYHVDVIPGGSISFQTALSTSTRRLPAHLVSALTIHRRLKQALWSHNHDTGSYDTLYQVDSSSSDVVIYWTMTGKHVPDRQQYDGHTHQLHLAKHQTWCLSTPYASRRYDTWCKYFISNRSFNEYSSTCSTPSVRTDYSS